MVLRGFEPGSRGMLCDSLRGEREFDIFGPPSEFQEFNAIRSELVRRHLFSFSLLRGGGRCCGSDGLSARGFREGRSAGCNREKRPRKVREARNVGTVNAKDVCRDTGSF